MAKITPVPDGPLIKKKGEFKGSTLKNGGKLKAIVKAGGQTHKVFKKKVDRGIGDKGDIVVDHTAGPTHKMRYFLVRVSPNFWASGFIMS